MGSEGEGRQAGSRRLVAAGTSVEPRRVAHSPHRQKVSLPPSTGTILGRGDQQPPRQHLAWRNVLPSQCFFKKGEISVRKLYIGIQISGFLAESESEGLVSQDPQPFRAATS